MEGLVNHKQLMGTNHDCTQIRGQSSPVIRDQSRGYGVPGRTLPFSTKKCRKLTTLNQKVLMEILVSYPHKNSNFTSFNHHPPPHPRQNLVMALHQDTTTMKLHRRELTLNPMSMIVLHHKCSDLWRQ